MDTQLKREDEAFRDEVRAFLEENLDVELREAGEKTSGISSAHDPLMRWHKILNEKGWVAPGWPQEFGGTGWSDMQRKSKKKITAKVTHTGRPFSGVYPSLGRVTSFFLY